MTSRIDVFPKEAPDWTNPSSAAKGGYFNLAIWLVVIGFGALFLWAELTAGAGVWRSVGAERRTETCYRPPVVSAEGGDRSAEEIWPAAHAHYAAGVVQEMDEDLEGALQEYQKAALADPGDEWLVLEVTQRLMH